MIGGTGPTLVASRPVECAHPVGGTGAHRRVCAVEIAQVDRGIGTRHQESQTDAAVLPERGTIGQGEYVQVVLR